LILNQRIELETPIVQQIVANIDQEDFAAKLNIFAQIRVLEKTKDPIDFEATVRFKGQMIKKTIKASIDHKKLK
jgi:hypothetical protein